MEYTLPKEIDSIEDAYSIVENLSNTFTGIYHYALRAQLSVLHAIQHPALLKTCVDTVFENLHQGIQIAQSEKEINLLRHKSALLVQGMLFYCHASILQKKKETREEGIELLKLGIDQIAQFTVNLAETVGTSGKTHVAKSAADSLGQVVSFLRKKEDGPERTKPSFFSRVIDNLFKEEENEELETEYLLLMDQVFEKFARNRKLLGHSIILSELVRNNCDDIIDFAMAGEEGYMSNLVVAHISARAQFFNNWYYLIYFLIFGVIGVSWIIGFFSDTSYISKYFMWYWLFFPLPIYLYSVISNSIRRGKLQHLIDEQGEIIQEQRTALRKKYEDIADALNPYS